MSQGKNVQAPLIERFMKKIHEVFINHNGTVGIPRRVSSDVMKINIPYLLDDDIKQINEVISSFSELGKVDWSVFRSGTGLLLTIVGIED